MSKQDIPAMRNVMDVERKYGKTFAETMGLASDAKETAEGAAQRAEDIDKNFTEEQGIYHKDGKWYVNAERAVILMLSADSIVSGKLSCDFLNGGIIKGQAIQNGDGTFSVSADGSMVAKKATIIGVLTCSEGSEVGGFKTDGNSIFKTPAGSSYGKGTFMSTGTTNKYKIGGSDEIPGWVFGAGGKFGVTKDGAVYANDVHLTGEINATSGSFAGEIKAKEGNIGDWHIGEVEVSTPNGTIVYSGIALYSNYLYDADENSETRITLTPEAVYIDGRDSTGASVYEHATWQKIIKAASLV